MNSLRRLSTSVGSKIQRFERRMRSKNTENQDEQYKIKMETKPWWKFQTRLRNSIRASRYSGVPLAMMYGILMYLYLSLMVLSDSKVDTSTNSAKTSYNFTSLCRKPSINDNQYSLNESMKINQTVRNLTKPGDNVTRTLTQPLGIKGNFNSSSTINGTNLNQTLPTNRENDTIKDEPFYKDTNFISFAVSSGFTIITGTASIFSRSTRCTLMLILPGIITGRGRAVLMTLVIGLVIEGPITTIDNNVNRIVESASCMLQSMKSLLCLHKQQVEQIITHFVAILKEQQQSMTEEIRKIQNQTGKALEVLRERQKKLKEKLHSDLEKMRDILKDINTPCQHTESVLGSIGKFFQGLIKRRRRRSVKICGISVPFPNIDFKKDFKVDSDQMEMLRSWIKDIIPELNLDTFRISDLEKLWEVPSVYDIREKILHIVSELFTQLREYLTVLKKCFLLISFLFLTIDSKRYLTRYYSDDAFDNLHIDNNIRELWRFNGYDKLTPLRHWELNSRYRVSASPKLSKDEVKRILLKAMPSIIVTITAIFLLISDYALAELLDTLAVNGKFALSFRGMEEGMKLRDIFTRKEMNNGSFESIHTLNLQKVDLSTDPCLPRPSRTQKKDMGIIIFLLIFIMLSCVCDVYAMRLRAKICNTFYKGRANERAVYLHKAIVSGRKTRRFQLQMIVSRELQRRVRLKDFSVIYRFSTFIAGKMGKKMSCPGCLWSVPKRDTKEIKITEEKQMVECFLCSDCAKDF